MAGHRATSNIPPVSADLLTPKNSTLRPDLRLSTGSEALGSSTNTTSEKTGFQPFNNVTHTRETLGSPSTPNVTLTPKPPRPPGAGNAFRQMDLDVIHSFSAGQIAIFFLTVLISLPIIIKRLSNPRAKQGWALRRSEKSTELSDSIESKSQSRRETPERGSFEIASTFLAHRFTLNRPLKHARLSIGRILLVMLYILMVLAALAYNNITTTSVSRHFRRFGFVALAQLPPLFLLSMKNNICGMFGVSYERVNFLHRLVGRVLLLCALAHGIMILQLQTAPLAVILSKRVFIHGLSALIILILIFLTSVSPVRSSIYQIFRIIHVLGYITFTVALWQHVNSSHPYIYFGAGCVIVDRLLRFINTRWRTAHFTSLPGCVTMIEVTKTGTGWKAGQHVFLRVYSPKYIFEKHPFTIANAPASHSPYGTNNTLILVTKAHGDYTRRLHQVGLTKAALEPEWAINNAECNYSPGERDRDSGKSFKDGEFGIMDPITDSQLMVSVEGPYGTIGVDLRLHETAVLIASGIGITFCVSLLEEIVGSALRGIGVTRKVFLIWTLKDVDMVEAFINPIEETLRVARALDLCVSFRLHVTASMGTFIPDPVPELLLIAARPSIKHILKEVVDVTLTEVNNRDGVIRGSGIAVAVCTGVDSLVRDVQQSIRAYDRWTVDKVGGIELHLESFGDG